MSLPSQRTQYGLLALIDLAGQPVGSRPTIPAIAQRRGIPVPFLHGIMRSLAATGLVVSRRGKTGGCDLARPAGGITVQEVVAALEGQDAEPRADQSPVLAEIWKAADAASAQVLTRITISELAAREAALIADSSPSNRPAIAPFF